MDRARNKGAIRPYRADQIISQVQRKRLESARNDEDTLKIVSLKLKENPTERTTDASSRRLSDQQEEFTFKNNNKQNKESDAFNVRDTSQRSALRGKDGANV